jgi:hypothetical protein
MKIGLEQNEKNLIEKYEATALLKNESRILLFNASSETWRRQAPCYLFSRGADIDIRSLCFVSNEIVSASAEATEAW